MFSHGNTFPIGTVYVKPLALMNYGYEQQNSDLAALYLEDITSEKNSRSHAAASAASSSSALSSRDAAGSSASAAYQDRLAAEAANGAAAGSAAAAAGSAAAADGSRAQAQTFSQLSANFSGGLVNQNATFFSYDDPNSGKPDQWRWWNVGTYSGRLYGNGTGDQPTWTPVENSRWAWYQGCNADVEGGLYIDNRIQNGGWKVLEATIQLRDGANTRGAGLLLYLLNSSGFVTSSAICDFFADEDTAGATFTNGKLASQWVVRRFAKLVYLEPNADHNSFTRFYAMTNWSGLGQGLTGKNLGWFRAGWRDASEAEITARKAFDNAATNASTITTVQSTLTTAVNAVATRASNLETRAGNLESRTSITEQTASDLKSGVAAARIQLLAATPGGRASVTIKSDNNGGAGVDIEGDVRFRGKLDVQSSPGSGRRSQLTDNHILFDNGTVMKVSGNGFGSSNQFIEWTGPSKGSINQCSEADAISYVRTDGSAYFGGTLSAGTLKNAVGTSSIDANASVSTGQLGSNGGSRIVVLSYSWIASQQVNVPQEPSSGGGLAATVVLRRNGQQVAVLNTTGTWNKTAAFSQQEPGGYREEIGGSLTYTDNSGGLVVEYSAHLINRTLGPQPGGTGASQRSQRISIVQTEQ